jgi:hypothetical protein
VVRAHPTVPKCKQNQYIISCVGRRSAQRNCLRRRGVGRGVGISSLPFVTRGTGDQRADRGGWSHRESLPRLTCDWWWVVQNGRDRMIPLRAFLIPLAVAALIVMVGCGPCVAPAS